MKSVLAVDDSVSMRQMVSATLQQKGFEVSQAGDGDEALSLARQREFALVITDVNMPKMDGITLVKRLRELPNYKFTPLLLLTTESSPEMKNKGKEAGATGWLVKPFDPDRLVATVDKVIR